MEIKITSENDPRKYVGYDLAGYPFNRKFPPNKTLYGDNNEGYSNKALGVFLYDYAVMGYDVEFSYHDKKYILLNNGEGIIYASDAPNHKRTYDDPMELLENFRIGDKTLLELSPEITNIEPV